MSDMFSLEGKVAVIVGGAGGIGELIALGLAEQGARVAIASRNMQKLDPSPPGMAVCGILRSGISLPSTRTYSGGNERLAMAAFIAR